MKHRAAKHVYRRDDRVVIVEPLVVTRVGYPLSLEDGLKHVEPLIGKDLVALFAKAGARAHCCYDLAGGLAASDRDYDAALRAIAHSWLKAEGFGGPQRTIHTDLREQLRGLEARVTGKRTVRTGVRHSGCGSGWEGDDGSPPELRDVRSHVLLELEVYTEPSQEVFSCPEVVEVEECHVRPAALVQQEAA